MVNGCFKHANRLGRRQPEWCWLLAVSILLPWCILETMVPMVSFQSVIVPADSSHVSSRVPFQDPQFRSGVDVASLDFRETYSLTTH